MFIFQNSDGQSHLIHDSESLRKSLGLPTGARTIFMTDEDGHVLSVGNNIHQLERNGQLIKSLRSDEVEGNSDDTLIAQLGAEAKARKKFDRSVAKQPIKHAVNARLILPKSKQPRVSGQSDTVKPNATRFQKSLAMSEKRVGLLGLIDELQALHKSYGLS